MCCIGKSACIILGSTSPQIHCPSLAVCGVVSQVKGQDRIHVHILIQNANSPPEKKQVMHSIRARTERLFTLSHLSIKRTSPASTHPAAAALIVIAAGAYLMFYGLSILLPFGVPLWTHPRRMCGCIKLHWARVCVCECAPRWSLQPALLYRFSSKSSCARPSIEPISHRAQRGPYTAGKYVCTYSVMMPLYNGCGWCAPRV